MPAIRPVLIVETTSVADRSSAMSSRPRGRSRDRQVPCAAGGGVPGEVGEVLGRAAQGALDAVGDTGVAAVENLAEQVRQQLDNIGGHAVGEGSGSMLLDGHRLV